VRNSGWMVIGQGLSVLLQAAYFVLLARLLGVREYGVYGGAFALAAIASVYTSLGSGTLFMRYVSSDHALFPQYWGNILLATASTSLALVTLLYFIAHYTLNPASAQIVVLAGISNCLCGQLTTCVGQVFQTFEKLHVTAAFNLITNLARLMAAAAMAATMHSATARQWAIASLIVSVIVLVIAVVAVTWSYGRPRFSPRLLVAGAAEGFGYSFASSTSSAFNDLDKAMLSHYGMNVANGIYTMAYRVIDIASIPVYSIRDAAMPRFFREGVGGLALASGLVWRLLKRAAPLTILAAIAMFLCAPLLPLIVGRGFSETVSAVRWLCLIPFFRSFHQMTGSALTGAGLQRYRTATQFSAAALNFGLNLWLIPTHSWLGAAWASLATDGLLGVGNWSILTVLSRRQDLSTPILASSGS
jgi:O-antigen/teichoic acid export membrane protein